MTFHLDDYLVDVPRARSMNAGKLQIIFWQFVCWRAPTIRAWPDDWQKTWKFPAFRVLSFGPLEFRWWLWGTHKVYRECEYK